MEDLQLLLRHRRKFVSSSISSHNVSLRRLPIRYFADNHRPLPGQNLFQVWVSCRADSINIPPVPHIGSIMNPSFVPAAIFSVALASLGSRLTGRKNGRLFARIADQPCFPGLVQSPNPTQHNLLNCLIQFQIYALGLSRSKVDPKSWNFHQRGVQYLLSQRNFAFMSPTFYCHRFLCLTEIKLRKASNDSHFAIPPPINTHSQPDIISDFSQSLSPYAIRILLASVISISS